MNQAGQTQSTNGAETGFLRRTQEDARTFAALETGRSRIIGTCSGDDDDSKTESNQQGVIEFTICCNTAFIDASG